MLLKMSVIYFHTSVQLPGQAINGRMQSIYEKSISQFI